MLPNIKTILYVSDLKGETWPSMRLAYSIAQQYGAKLIYVHVVNHVKELRETMKDFEINSRVDIEEILTKATAKADSRMKRNIEKFLAAELQNADNPVEIEIQVAEGYAAQTILRVAEKEEADLIVMSTRTHGTVGQVVGSTTNKVMHHGKFPVLVIPYY